MKCGFWVMGWCASFGVLACGGRAITTGDSGGSDSTLPATGGAPGHGGTSSAPSTSGSTSSNPSFGGSTSSNPGFGGTPSQAGAPNVGATGNVPGMPDPGSASCMDFLPCGGNLVGEWRFTNVCVSPPLPVGDAPYCPTDQVTSDIGGTLSFQADGRVIPVTTYTNHHVVPASCLAALGGCGTPNGALSGCRSAHDGSCLCDSSNPSGAVDGETYVSSGNDYFLLTESPHSPPITIYYCQAGNQLIMRATDQGRIFVYQLARP